ncbi:MAG TPA: hypothetical protein VL403_10915 [Candidatus Kryptonia bacterium]|nr:hypothetical protein [Candidatus Kryptonia bacterium]
MMRVVRLVSPQTHVAVAFHCAPFADTIAADMDRTRWLAEKRTEVARLGNVPVSEITPSRRDFRLHVTTQRQELAVIARIQRIDPETQRATSDAELLAHAAACDDAEVAAIAVATDAQRGGSLELLRAVVNATQAPVLRDDFVLAPNQLYDARLHGADAAIIPAAEVDHETLAELVRVASSLHMAAIVEVESAADLGKAVAVNQTVVGLNADIDTMLDIAQRVPPNRTVLALREPDDFDTILRLRGKVDAVSLGPMLPDGTEIARALARLNGS